MNLGDILTKLDVQVNADGLQKMLSGLSEGYQEYVKSHPEADYSNLGNQIAEYLTSNQAKTIIQKYLKDILKNNGEVMITPEQIKELLTSVMSDFQSWLTEQNANPGAEEFGTYFQQYLQTGRANAIVNKWANEIFGNIDFDISSDTLQAMAKELADGYTAYAKEKNYADPTKMAENFVNYIKTDDGKRRLNQGLYEAINMDSLQKQISTAMSSYMGQAMSAYTGAISQAISTQMTSAMSQVTTQLAGGLETVMTSAMSRIGENLQKALGGSMNFNADAFANAFRFNMTEDDLTELMMSMSGTQSASYDNNLQQLGYADFSQPSSISIYPKDFDNKEKVVEVLDHYNQQMEDDVKEEQVICTNGASELLYAFAAALKPKKALLLEPGFAEYEAALSAVGCEIFYYPLGEEKGYALDLAYLEALSDDLDMIILCNPNNPTGVLIQQPLLVRIAEKCEKYGIHFLLDECFHEFLMAPDSYSMRTFLERFPHLFLVDAFTKIYAIPGLRLGYGLSADADLLEKIRNVIQPWSVSIPAQEAGIAALSEDTYVHNTRWLIREERKYLARALHLLEMETFDSQANYLFFKGPEDLEEQCQKRGLLIRDCSNYRGLSKGYFRIAVRTREENDQLIKIFQDIIREKQKESGAIYGWRK